MNIKKGDMISIKQDFIDRNNRYEYDSRDIWEVKEVYNIGGGYHVAAINNLTGYGNAHLCTYNMDLRTIDDLKARLPQNDNIAKVKNNNINTCKIMEKRMITKPFDLELAKKISNGECNGEIVTVGDNYKAMDKALERAIGNKVIDFEKCEGNYLDVYPLIGAVLQKELRSVLSGNVNKSISRNMKIKATKYRNNYRVWLDYAGDYRNENIE
jgi:hypothetical protein